MTTECIHPQNIEIIEWIYYAHFCPYKTQPLHLARSVHVLLLRALDMRFSGLLVWGILDFIYLILLYFCSGGQIPLIYLTINYPLFHCNFKSHFHVYDGGSKSFLDHN